MRAGHIILWIAAVSVVGCHSRATPPRPGAPPFNGRSTARPSSPPAPAHPDGGVAAAVTITDRAAPPGVLGVHWGMTRAEITALARAAGIVCHDSGEYVFCPRATVPVPTPAVASYEFCGEGLCSVALDGVRTRDETRIRGDFTALLDVMQHELGPAASTSQRVAAGCSGHLALCLTSRQAEFRARWSWRDGSQAVVSADQDEADAFMAQVSATYLSPERARRIDPEPAPFVTVTGDGGQATTP